MNEGERLGVIASSPGHFQGEWPGSEARDEGEEGKGKGGVAWELG